jgi:hypothetical protein
MITNPAEVHLRVVELGGAGRLPEALVFIDPDVIDHRGGISGDHVGLAAWKEKWERMGTLPVTVENNVAAGEFSTNRYTVRGKDATSGRDYEVTGLDMVRVRDGKIVEHWALVDTTAMRAQISLLVAHRAQQAGAAGARGRARWLGGLCWLAGDDGLGHPVEQRERAGDDATGPVDVVDPGPMTLALPTMVRTSSAHSSRLAATRFSRLPIQYR